MSSGADTYTREFTGGVKRLLVQMAVWAVLVTAGLFLAGHEDKILGYLVGTGVSVTYVLLICYRVRRSASLPPREAVSYMRTGWIIRLAFIVLMLIWSLKVPAIHFVSAVAGLLSLQIILFFNGIYLVAKRYMSQ